MRSVAIALVLSVPLLGLGQSSTESRQEKTLPNAVKQDWHNLDFDQNKLYGTSANRVYGELIKDSKPKKRIVVAVIDSGVEVDHDDLDGSIWTNADEIPGNGIDDDSNGYIDDVHGWNFLVDSNGTDVRYATLEATRIISLSKALKAADMRYPAWLTTETINRATEIYNEQVEEYNSVKDIGDFFFTLDSALQVLTHKTDYTIDDVLAIPNPNPQLQSVQDIYKSLGKAGLTKEDLADMAEHSRLLSRYYLNEQFGARGDLDTSDRFYGNNHYEGPDANHGTHVAGIIASNRINKLGSRGIAHGSAEIMTLRVVPDGDEEDVDVANGIRYAVDNGASIINMSFGKGVSPYKDLVGAALKYASDNNVLVVHAAGNDSDNSDQVDNFPDPGTAGAELSYITVAASTYSKKHLAASFSNYGVKVVDIFSPGEDLWSTVPDNTYEFNSGTSMAAPAVSGVAALVWSYFPGLTAMELKHILLDSAVKPKIKKVVKPGSREKVPFSSLSRTGGIVNAYSAFEAAQARTSSD